MTTRVRTGISELDRMLGGGFMEGDMVLVAGSAGTGKTILGLQHLVNGVTQFGENGIYVTFEELPEQIYRDAANLGWDLRKMEREDKLRVVCTSPDLLLETRDGEHLLDEPMKQIHGRRIVIDSLSQVAIRFEEMEKVRREAHRLLMYFKAKRLSSMCTWETPQILGDSFSLTDVGLSFLVDCIVLLKLVEIQSSMHKLLVVLKMRGSDHDKKLREFEITSQGIELMTPIANYEGLLSGYGRRSVTDEAARKLAEAFGAKPLAKR